MIFDIVYSTLSKWGNFSIQITIVESEIEKIVFVSNKPITRPHPTVSK